MSREFLGADEMTLIMLVMLVNRFFLRGSLEVAKEIRAIEKEFGLTPLSRRRLQWQVAKAEEATDEHEQKRIKRAQVVDVDPREAMDL